VLRRDKPALERLTHASEPWLPMPLGDDTASLGWDEWYEYQERHARHLTRFPKYDSDGRPTAENTTAISDLIKEDLDRPVVTSPSGAGRARVAAVTT
jgi:hypothetical protein